MMFERLKAFATRYCVDTKDQPCAEMVTFLIEEMQNIDRATAKTFCKLNKAAVEAHNSSKGLANLYTGMRLVLFPTMVRQLDTVCIWLAYYPVHLDLIEAEFRAALEEIRVKDTTMFKTENNHGILKKSINGMVADWLERATRNRELREAIEEGKFAL